MGVDTCDRWNEEATTERGLLAGELLRHDVYGLPDEQVLVFCPECCEMAESFGLIEHKDRCFYGGGPSREWIS
jgi:hypothetical protein